MSDFEQIDLSTRTDTDLTLEERAELQRRFRSFTQAVKEASLMRPAAPEKPKKVSKWNPLARTATAKAGG